MSEPFLGPDDLAKAVLDARSIVTAVGELVIDETDSFGNISADGIGRLITVAFYASLSPNEERFPRFTL